MTARLIESGLKVFATCPPSYTASPLVYRREVLDSARWSDAAGCEGILVYTDNGLVDPWLIAQDIITHTHRLCPLERRRRVRGDPGVHGQRAGRPVAHRPGHHHPHAPALPAGGGPAGVHASLQRGQDGRHA